MIFFVANCLLFCIYFSLIPDTAERSAQCFLLQKYLLMTFGSTVPESWQLFDLAYGIQEMATVS
jgi:hypothetical protein